MQSVHPRRTGEPGSASRAHCSRFGIQTTACSGPRARTEPDGLVLCNPLAARRGKPRFRVFRVPLPLLRPVWLFDRTDLNARGI